MDWLLVYILVFHWCLIGLLSWMLLVIISADYRKDRTRIWTEDELFVCIGTTITGPLVWVYMVYTVIRGLLHEDEDFD